MATIDVFTTSARFRHQWATATLMLAQVDRDFLLTSTGFSTFPLSLWTPTRFSNAYLS